MVGRPADRGMFFPFLQVVELVSNSASARSLKQQNVCSTTDEYGTRSVVPDMLDSQKTLEQYRATRNHQYVVAVPQDPLSPSGL